MCLPFSSMNSCVSPCSITSVYSSKSALDWSRSTPNLSNSKGLVAGADADDEPPLAKRIDHRDLLCEADWRI